MKYFYEEFPVYKTRKLVLTGESFAGKYLSYSALAILNYNEQSGIDYKLPLSNLVLFDPLVDTPTERYHQVELPYALGLYDDYQVDQVEVLRRKCEEGPSRGDSVSDQTSNCKNLLNYALKMTGDMYSMDAREFNW